MRKEDYEALLNMPVSDLSLETQTNIWFGGTKYITEFSRAVMVPILNGQVGLSEKESGIIELYFRMLLLMETIIHLNNVRHFQTVASTVRSLFELWIDIAILVQDSKGLLTEKFIQFVERERYRVAKNIVDYDDSNPGVLRDVLVEREYCADPERIKKYKGVKLKAGEHWSGQNDLRKRAKQVGCEDLYLQWYGKLSWQVHSGTVGITGLPQEYFWRLFGVAHALAQRIFIDATKACAKDMRIAELDYFNQWVEEARLKSGALITQEQIKLLDQRRAAKVHKSL